MQWALQSPRQTYRRTQRVCGHCPRAAGCDKLSPPRVWLPGMASAYSGLQIEISAVTSFWEFLLCEQQNLCIRAFWDTEDFVKIHNFRQSKATNKLSLATAQGSISIAVPCFKFCEKWPVKPLLKWQGKSRPFRNAVPHIGGTHQLCPFAISEESATHMRKVSYVMLDFMLTSQASPHETGHNSSDPVWALRVRCSLALLMINQSAVVDEHDLALCPCPALFGWKDLCEERIIVCCIMATFL